MLIIGQHLLILIQTTSLQNDFYFTGHNVNLHLFLFGLTFSLSITVRKSRLKQKLCEVFSPALLVFEGHLSNSTVHEVTDKVSFEGVKFCIYTLSCQRFIPCNNKKYISFVESFQ